MRVRNGGQAYLSGLSHYNGKPAFDLELPAAPLFGDTELYTPYYLESCSTCGSRLTCNGCSRCGRCGKL